MLKAFANAFRAPARPVAADVAIMPEIARSIVASRSHGNVRLQDRRYYTEADVDAEYEMVRGADLTV